MAQSGSLQLRSGEVSGYSGEFTERRDEGRKIDAKRVQMFGRLRRERWRMQWMERDKDSGKR